MKNFARLLKIQIFNPAKIRMLLIMSSSLFFFAYTFKDECTDMIHKAKKAEAKGNYVRAIKILDHAIRVYTLNHELYFERGMLKTNLKGYQEGINDLTRAIDLKPD